MPIDRTSANRRQGAGLAATHARVAPSRASAGRERSAASESRCGGDRSEALALRAVPRRPDTDGSACIAAAMCSPPCRRNEANLASRDHLMERTDR